MGYLFGVMAPREPLRESKVREWTDKGPSHFVTALEKYNNLIDMNLTLLPIDFCTTGVRDLVRLNDLKGLAEVVVPCRAEFCSGLFDQNVFAVDVGEPDLLDLREEVRAGLP